MALPGTHRSQIILVAAMDLSWTHSTGSREASYLMLLPRVLVGGGSNEPRRSVSSGCLSEVIFQNAATSATLASGSCVIYFAVPGRSHLPAASCVMERCFFPLECLLCWAVPHLQMYHCTQCDASSRTCEKSWWSLCRYVSRRRKGWRKFGISFLHQPLKMQRLERVTELCMSYLAAFRSCSREVVH